jgi:integrase/recombinase XerD
MDDRSSRRTAGVDSLAVIDAWLRSHASPNTRAAYRTDLAAFGRWCAQYGAVPLTADTATVVAFHAAREAAGDSTATLRRRWSSLSSFYQFAIDTDSAAVNPVAGADRPKALAGDPSTTPNLSARAVDDYIALAAALDPRLDALVSLLVFDGLKLGEALALDVDDIRGRPPKLSLTVRRKGESRRVDLSADSVRAVHRCAGRRRGQPLFTSGRSTADASPRRLTRFGADHLIRQLSAEGEERVTANALRRFHFISSHAAGTDLDHVRQRAGLAHVRSLRRYLHELDDDRDDDRSAGPAT